LRLRASCHCRHAAKVTTDRRRTRAQRRRRPRPPAMRCLLLRQKHRFRPARLPARAVMQPAAGPRRARVTRRIRSSFVDVGLTWGAPFILAGRDHPGPEREGGRRQSARWLRSSAAARHDADEKAGADVQRVGCGRMRRPATTPMRRQAPTVSVLAAVDCGGAPPCR
jgi:hypothetical protein